MDILNFIDGDFAKPAQNAFFAQERPFNDKSVQVSNSSALDLVKAIQGSHTAFNTWKDSSLEDRIQLVDKISQYLETHKIQFAESEAWDQGLNLQFSLTANIEVALEKLKDQKAQLQKGIPEGYGVLPVGVVGVVLSWNLSTRVFAEKVLPAVLAGNSVIVKASSYSPVTVKLWGELFRSVGLTAGLVQMLHSQDVAFKKLFITHPGIKALLVTGNLENTSEIIKTVAQMTTQQFKKLQIHSGSKNTAAALNEPNEAEMGEILNSFLQGQGQLAWNSSRLFILDKHEKQWTDFVAHKLQNLKPSESIHDSSPWTPLMKMKSVDQFASLMMQAKTDQAKILSVDGVLPSNKYVKPFFTKDMSNCSVLQQDQVHGPAFILSTVKYGFDIPKYSNVSYYGHSASVWTEAGKNQKVIQALDVGLVSTNQWSIYSPGVVEGVKQSSFGNMNSQIFGDFFSNVKKLT
ncbi:aldehyde dehydrogenase family protein [Pseudobdellovibrio sp. HCB154]|uniref:aldehyde dehydrogenase family protein n=1 Tax=Pseudobdellovibrio sp. HCB154 TaxID=3386277 RepID=UPI003916DEB2